MLLGTGFCFEALIHSGEAKPWKGTEQRMSWIPVSQEQNISEFYLSGCLQLPTKHLRGGAQAG